MYLEVAKRDLRSSHHKKKKTKNGDFCVWWMLTRLTVANISQHITSFWGKASLSARLHFLQASYVNKSMSRLSLWLSLNSFCAETWRTWTSVRPDTRTERDIWWILLALHLREQRKKTENILVLQEAIASGRCCKNEWAHWPFFLFLFWRLVSTFEWFPIAQWASGQFDIFITLSDFLKRYHFAWRWFLSRLKQLFNCQD